MLIRSLSVPALIVIGLASEATAQTSRVERTVRGDTTIVRTTGNGVWGPRKDAIPVLTITESHAAAVSGPIKAVAGTPGGGVVYFDDGAPEGPIARVLSSNGAVIASFGRKGEGPGEVRYCNDNCLIVSSDGVIAMHDFAKGVNRYRNDGSFIGSFTSRFGMGPLPQVLGGPNSSLFLRTDFVPREPGPLAMQEEIDRWGFVEVSASGQVLDSIARPNSWLTSTPRSFWEPRTLWTLLPDGRLAAGGSDRLAVLIRHPDVARGLLLIEAPSGRVPFGPQEKREIIARAEWHNREMAMGSVDSWPTTLPALKPAYKAIIADNDGRIWLQRHVTGVPGAKQFEMPVVRHEGGGTIPPAPPITYQEQPVFAGFKLDGTYLGEVRFPLGATHISFVGNYAWAVVTDQDDVETLIKFRLPGAARN